MRNIQMYDFLIVFMQRDTFVGINYRVCDNFLLLEMPNLKKKIPCVFIFFLYKLTLSEFAFS